MKKNGTKGYAILGILFALVSIIAFAVPTMKTAPFWIAYVFTVAAFIAQAIIWNKVLGKEETLKSKFLGFPIVHIGIVYVIIQTVALAVFLFVATLPTCSAIVACTIISGVSAVCMISADAECNEIERVEANIHKKIFYIQELQTDVERMSTDEADTNTKTALIQLAQKIRFSDPMSNEQLSYLESKISNKVLELKIAANKMELVAELTSLLDERNKKCKILK